MHQQARAPARLSSPPSSQPSQSRNSSTREALQGNRQRAGSTVSGVDAMSPSGTENVPAIGPPAESVKKLDQIVQNFYAKAAVLILDARIKVTTTRNANGMSKTNKWFQIETDEIDDFRDEFKVWKTCGSLENQPPTMIIEVYLDLSLLRESQSLVMIDDDGKRWNVSEQLSASASSTASNSPSGALGSAEVVLERWRVELKSTHTKLVDDFGPVLPTIYKKAIVFFRTLFMKTRLNPVWKVVGAAPSAHPALVPRCRIRTSEPHRSSHDPLRQSLDGHPDPVSEYMFGDLDVPVGRLRASVAYRNCCRFRVDDSESLLSSHFMRADENFFKPSLPPHGGREHEATAGLASLRSNHRAPDPAEIPQTYGSLSTFHTDQRVGTSPISALRAVKPPGSDTSSPPASFPSYHGIDPPNSLPIRASSTRVPVRHGDGHARRTSISTFQPFKAGSLSGSPVPRTMDPESPVSTHALSRPSLISGSRPRTRSSLTAGMPSSLRGGPPATTAADPLVIGSPRPSSTSRYSSSFTHRRARLSMGGASKGGDEENSSGRQSLASSLAQPGSGLLAEAGPASSGSIHAEGDDISDFLKALDSKKTLKSFEPAKKGESATNRTVAQLSRFRMMRDSHNALGDSMTSSMQMQRSSSTSSRQLPSVPSMTVPPSMSTSTSPGKPASPHTPHTPAIPSRLSENSIIDYGATGRVPAASRRPQEPTVAEVSRENSAVQDGTPAMDIPLSPLLNSYQRRSSSVAQKNRTLIEVDENELAFAAGHRSISLGASDREPPTLSTLLGRQMELESSSAGRDNVPTGLQPAAEIQPSGSGSSEVMQRGSAEASLPDGLIRTSAPSSSPLPRRRYAGMAAAARETPRRSSRGSITGSSSKLGRPDDESEEPLVFDLSEMEAHGRRSLEEARAGRNLSLERSAGEQRGTTRRGWT
ncbi:autophagy protein Atg13 [Drechmeria coniospora]|uniref:Autophagy-related protein 13 n=1 Tax=Drechmeria coniospora TaxID=98403 RepID=A0A151GDI3_DRECN|nr:autophagy protein Atg13 [Drechmeria coniospora]KYK55159.1 autophagy protein Atg13 [Drechmeria coniospora]